MEPGGKKQKTACPDIILRLPPDLLHSIVDLLDPRDMARMSVISKAWYNIWKALPYIAYDVKVEKDLGEEQKRALSIGLKRSIIHQLYKEKVNDITFDMDFPDIEKVKPVLDHFLRVSLDKGVVSLRLLIRYISQGSVAVRYRAPQKIWTAATLKCLLLYCCTFEAVKLNIRLPNLESLTILGCNFAAKSVCQKIIRGCPMIKVLKCSDCRGMGTYLYIVNSPKLNVLWIEANHGMEKVVIRGHSIIKELYVQWICQKGRIYMDELPALKVLRLCAKESTYLNVCLKKYIPERQTLECLELRNCKCLRSFRDSAPTCQTLILDHCCIPCFPEFYSPALLRFEFHNSKKPYSFPESAIQLQHLEFCADSYEIPWLDRLKEFLSTLKHYDNMKLVIYKKRIPESDDSFNSAIMHNKVRDVSLAALQNMKDLSRICISTWSYGKLMDLFLPYYPNIIYVIYSCRRTVEELYEEMPRLRKDWDGVYSRFKLVFKAVITGSSEEPMDPASRDFIESHSKEGYQNATLFLEWKKTDEQRH